MYELSFKKMSEIKLRWGIHKRGEHGVLGSIYKGGKREISVRSVGRLVSISTDPSRFIIG